MARIIAEMELRGVLIDSKAIAKLSKLTTSEIKKLEKEIYKLSGMEFNINSPRQLSEVLFEKLGLKGKVRKTGKGALSTAAPELEKLVNENPIINFILKYREVQKLKTTYIDPFPTLISSATGRLHTTFNQTGTTTGRLASQDPNLQNIPVKTELGQEFRKAFISSPGFKLVSFDYSQIELRIAAHISRDEKMIAAFRRGEDIHTRTAAEIFGVKPEDVDKNMRRDAKVLNFGILYGMGVLGFQRASGVSREKAREFIDKYMKEFSGVAKYMDDMKVKAHRDGYVSTIFGRRRWLPEIKSSMPQIVSQAERMAINMPIQGTAADLIKLAMINVFEYIHGTNNQNNAFLLLQVHDELLFEIKESSIEELGRKIKEFMENVHKFDVPLIIDIKYGDNWADLTPI
ncbi:MAG: DNA polymerase [Patescibacteria group bacterium]